MGVAFNVSGWELRPSARRAAGGPFDHPNPWRTVLSMSTSRVAAGTILILSIAAACTRGAGNGGTSYGEAITLQDTTLVSQILADPDAYVGERVLVAATVVDVCENRGCWLELASDAEFDKIRVKVDDGVIVFPLSARGHRAVVEGIVEKLTLTEEEVLEREKHHAEEQGLEFDPSTVTGPETVYQIRGLGAVIEK